MPEVRAESASHLFSLPVSGVASDQVEAASSYLCRLADAYLVPAHRLAVLVLSEAGVEHALSDWPKHSLDGMSAGAGRFVGSLQSLTLNPEVHTAALLRWRRVVANLGLLRANLAWCSICLEEDKASAHSPYYRLLWRVPLVKHCPKHSVPFAVLCPNPVCKAIQPVLNWRSRVGHCSACGSWLGGLNHSERRSDITQWDTFVCTEIGRLLASPADIPDPTRQQLAASVCRLRESTGRGNNQFARVAQAPKTSVGPWMKGERLPTMEGLCRIARAHSVSLVDIVLGRAEAKIVQLSLPLAAKPRPRQASHANLAETVRGVLLQTAQSDCAVTWRELERQTKVTRRTILLHAPEPAQLVMSRNRELRRLEAIGRAATRAAAASACGRDSRLRSPSAPTWKLAEESGLSGAFKDPRIKAAFESGIASANAHLGTVATKSMKGR